MVDLVLRLAHEWSIVAYSPEDAIKWAIGQLTAMRQAITDNQHDMFDLVAEYMNEHLAETVQVFHSPNSSPLVDYQRLPRNSVRVRIDAYRNTGSTDITKAIMFLDRTHFRKWYADKGQNPREFVSALQAEGADATPSSQKGTLGKNTPLAIPQTYVIGIDLTHPRMAGVLDDVVEASKQVDLNNVVDLRGRQ